MAQITAQMVKDLREQTGAGMMDCKAALGETNGDMEAAVDWLRKKGLSKAAKKADRVAAEGLIGVAVTGTKGVVVEVNSETDFVARNDLFQGLVKMIANVALDVGADVEKIKAAKAGSMTIAEDDRRNRRQDRREHDAAPRRRAFGRQGRDRQLRAQLGDRRRSARSACWSRWNRPARPTSSRRSAGWSRCTSPRPIRRRSIRRVSIRRWSTREKDVLADKFKAQGKPAAMIEKIVESGLKTYYKEVCLLDQPYIHDDKKNVAQALKEAEGKVGGPIKVTGFVRYTLGEGIEKQESDFAAEVAAAAGPRADGTPPRARGGCRMAKSQQAAG